MNALQLFGSSLLGVRRNENYCSWIRKNSVSSEFLRIQLRIVVCFLLPLAIVVVASLRCCSGEEIMIDLRNASRDPLIDLVPPPAGSPDRIQANKDGLRILQFTDVPGRLTGVTGFKSTLAASGDFSITLDLKINKLTGPSAGWGHGLIFAVFLDDESQTTLKLNQIAYRGQDSSQSMVEMSGRGVQTPTYQLGPRNFRDGKLIIERRGSVAIFSLDVAKEKERKEIGRIPCPTNDVRTVEVWSTRVDKGNAPADILLRSLQIDADAFYSYKRPVLGWITWWQLLIVGNVVVIGGLLGYRAWSNRRSD